MHFREGIAAMIFTCFAMQLVAQVGTRECDSWCATHESDCHNLKAEMFLDVSHFQSIPCWDEFKKSSGPMSARERVVRSLMERQLAAANSDWAAKQGDELLITIALTQELLGHESILSGDTAKASRYLADAAATYQKELDRVVAPISEKARRQVIRVVVGLVRCGKPIEALEAAQRLPPEDGERLYLKAEILMRIGEREHAALEFERWIQEGCTSSFPLITENEFGTQAILGYPKDAENRPGCAKLPQELRAELDSLKDETQHPNNLPSVNYPPKLIDEFTGYW